MQLKLVMSLVSGTGEEHVLTKLVDIDDEILSTMSLQEAAEEMKYNISDAIDKGVDDDRTITLSEELLTESDNRKRYSKPAMSFMPFYW